MSRNDLSLLGTLRAQPKQQQSTPKKVSKDDKCDLGREIFLKAMKDVRPLKASNRVPLETPHPTPRQFVQKSTQPSPITIHWSDEFCLEIPDDEENRYDYIHPKTTSRNIIQLKKNYWPIQAELDLHRHTREEARNALATFLIHALQKKLRCVCIIHGRGLCTKNHDPVLKPLVRRWLRQHDQVLAFCSAHLSNKESGAVKVLLHTNKKNFKHL